MVAYTVVAPLRTLGRELTAAAPRRTLPDWFLGDERHKAGVSDHNVDDTPGWRSEQSDADSIPEVRGMDIRLPFNAPFTPEQFVQWLVQQARAGKLPWLRYVIYKGRIWTRSGGWVTQQYNGSNPHDHHVHVSSLASRDTDTTSPRLAELVRSVQPKEEDMPITTEDAVKIWTHDLQNGEGVDEAYVVLNRAADTAVVVLAEVRALRGEVSKSAASIIQAVKADDNVDEQALAGFLAPMVVDGVLARLPAGTQVNVQADALIEAFRRAFDALPEQVADGEQQPVDEPAPQ